MTERRAHAERGKQERHRSHDHLGRHRCRHGIPKPITTEPVHWPREHQQSSGDKTHAGQCSEKRVQHREERTAATESLIQGRAHRGPDEIHRQCGSVGVNGVLQHLRQHAHRHEFKADPKQSGDEERHGQSRRGHRLPVGADVRSPGLLPLLACRVCEPSCVRCYGLQESQRRDAAENVHGRQRHEAGTKAKRRHQHEHRTQHTKDSAQRVRSVERAHAATVVTERGKQSFHRGKRCTHRRRGGQQREERKREDDEPLEKCRGIRAGQLQRELVHDWNEQCGKQTERANGELNPAIPSCGIRAAVDGSIEEPRAHRQPAEERRRDGEHRRSFMSQSRREHPHPDHLAAQPGRAREDEERIKQRRSGTGPGHYFPPRYTQRDWHVSATTTSVSSGSFGWSFFQIQIASISLVGFSRPGISLR